MGPSLCFSPSQAWRRTQAFRLYGYFTLFLTLRAYILANKESVHNKAPFSVELNDLLTHMSGRDNWTPPPVPLTSAHVLPNQSKEDHGSHCQPHVVLIIRVCISSLTIGCNIQLCLLLGIVSENWIQSWKKGRFFFKQQCYLSWKGLSLCLFIFSGTARTHARVQWLPNELFIQVFCITETWTPQVCCSHRCFGFQCLNTYLEQVCNNRCWCFLA